MKKLVCLLMAAILIGFAADAQKRKAAHTGKKKVAPVMRVDRGETKEYGDYLTTQIFSAKKGKTNSVKVEYPVSGNPQLVAAMRKYIKSVLAPEFTGSLDSPEDMIRKALKGARDVNFGQEGESLTLEIDVLYANSRVVTLGTSGYSYMGGAHGSSYEGGETYLVENGTVFTMDMLPPFSKMRPYILSGLAKYWNIKESELSDYLFSINDLEYPGVVMILEDGLNFVYQQYEIAPYAMGMPRAVVKVTPDIYNMLTAEGKKFFE